MDPEEMIECPYDKTHVIRVKRLKYHLLKCRKNHRRTDQAVCDFNAHHVMPRPEYRYDLTVCADKRLFEGDSISPATRGLGKGNTGKPPYDAEWNCPEPVEDWDAEAAVLRIGIDEKILNDPEWNCPEPVEDWDAEAAVLRIGIDEKIPHVPDI
ncbi:MAG: CHHC zinc finger protein, partial [Candidatus Omnitrophica bacterium]|nr:CHHC zinc finger protein [Candidatus Omnitrophota bacterium]